MSDTTRDGFLGGRLHLLQPKDGYRAGADPVFLAAACPARTGERVLDLGTGVGTALFCLGTRVSGLSLTGVDRQASLVALARENALATGIEARIFEADIGRLPAALRAESFDHVITNPPFFASGTGPQADTPSRAMGRGEDTPLAIWIDVAIRRLSPNGRLTVIWPAARLPELLGLLDARLGDVFLKPLAARTGRAAQTVLVTAKKGSRAQARLLAPLILHEGERHESDSDDYTTLARAILRDAAALDWR